MSQPEPIHTAAADPPAGSITKLIAGILDDSTTLFKQHVEMLQAEVKQDLGRAGSAAKYLGLGIFLVLLGLFFFLMGVPLLVHYLVPSLELWACWMIVGAALLVLGGVALVVGRSLMAKFNPVPHKTLNALSENAQWLTNRPK